MKYIISKFKCFLYNQTSFLLLPNVKYQIQEYKNNALLLTENCFPFVLNLTNSENVLKVDIDADSYYFIFPTYYKTFCARISYKNKDLFISSGGELCLNYDGETILSLPSVNVNYSHYEIVGELCLIYFTGERNFLIVVKDNEVLYCDYYDEYNTQDEEKYFMCKLCDSLNHGRVVHIKDKQFESYLVYLDNEDLNLKEEFVAHVFLDCLLAKNFKYCNELLYEEIKMENAENVKSFFPDFDYFYPIDNLNFILIKKNTLTGIYKFEIDNNKIVNITCR